MGYAQKIAKATVCTFLPLLQSADVGVGMTYCLDNLFMLLFELTVVCVLATERSLANEHNLEIARSTGACHCPQSQILHC